MLLVETQTDFFVFLCILLLHLHHYKTTIAAFMPEPITIIIIWLSRSCIEEKFKGGGASNAIVVVAGRRTLSTLMNKRIPIRGILSQKLLVPSYVYKSY